MGIALLSLKSMIWISVAALVVMVLVLIIYGRPDLVIIPLLGMIAQLTFLGVLLRFLSREALAAKWIFALWCLSLFFSGISSPIDLYALISYGLAILGFTGLAGLWKSYLENRRVLANRRINE